MTVYSKADIGDLKIKEGESLEECEFQGVDFSPLDLKGVTFLDCTFTNCNLANQSLTKTTMREPTFVGCNLMGINWPSLKRLEWPKYRECKLNFSSFQGLKLKKLEMTTCSAVEVDFAEADLTSADFSNTGLAGAVFERAILEGADFRTSRDYVIDVRTTKIKGAKFAYPQVMALIAALGAEIEM